MFNNPGGKIKGLAKFLFFLNLALYVIGGIVLIVLAFVREMYVLIAAGVGAILFGTLVSWLSVLFLYSYGCMVEDVYRIREQLDRGPAASGPRSAKAELSEAPSRGASAPGSNLCPFCGKPLAPGAVFCGSCGNGLRSTAARTGGSTSDARTGGAVRSGYMGTPTDYDL